jgi:hypothetical protein
MRPRFEPWGIAAIVLGVLLVEVWQTSRMAQLCLALDQTRSAFAQADARLEYLRAAAERRATRAELAPLADELGLAPADARQVVMLPFEYLADDRVAAAEERPSSLAALAERVSDALVPEATARSRVVR